MSASLEYLGPVDWYRAERAAGLSLPEGQPPSTVLSGAPGPDESVLIARLAGIPEARLQMLARLYPMLAELPLPEIPVQEMDALAELLRACLEAAADGRFDLQDIPELLQALKAVATLARRFRRNG